MPHINEDEAVVALHHILGTKPTADGGPTPRRQQGIRARRLHHVPRTGQWINRLARGGTRNAHAHRQGMPEQDCDFDKASVVQSWKQNGGTVIDKVQEALDVDQTAGLVDAPLLDDVNVSQIVLPENVLAQLTSFVKTVKTLYRDNPFHNFEHACTVTMAVSKFLSCMAKEKDTTLTVEDCSFGMYVFKRTLEMAGSTIDIAYLLTLLFSLCFLFSPLDYSVSDPLTQFAVVFAALLHDADHEGVPNTKLMKEQPDLAAFYQNKAIAEQRSVDVAFATLLQPEFRDLRQCIYRNENDMRCFRQLVVQAIMATDICDQDLREFRNRRWEKAFATSQQEDNVIPEKDLTSLKATISLELLMQVSNILHTTQPWKTYKSWERAIVFGNVPCPCRGSGVYRSANVLVQG